MDALVLSIVSAESTYGYKITQDVRSVMEVSESTLYPVLRRLQKDECLQTFDREFSGRNRRYYCITERAACALRITARNGRRTKRRSTMFCSGE